MASPALISRRTLLAIHPDGRETVVTIGLGAPYEVDPGREWACPVALDGLHARLADQHGVDSWQAMQLAYQLVLRLLDYFVEDGGVLLWPEDRRPMLVSELAPGSAPKGERSE